jgi:hypothetical protein
MTTSRVLEAEQRVADLETFTLKEWKKFKRSPKFEVMAYEYLIAKCITDFWSYLKYGVYFHAMKHYYEPMHGSEGMAGYLQDWTVESNGIRVPTNMKFLVVSREHCKTQEAMAWVTWMLMRDQNLRVMLRSHKDGAVYGILAGIKDIFMSDSFQHMFPWCVPATSGNKYKKWAEGTILLERELKGVRTNSIHAYGFNSDNTGEHFDIRVYDDWETAETANSDDLREKLFEKFKLDDPLMVGGAKTLCIGTPYFIRAWIMSAINRKRDFADMDYDTFVQPCSVKVFDRPFVGQEPILLDDRVTLRCMGAGFPTIEGNMELCQAKVNFFSVAAKDTVMETREVVWNDGQHFRVNRPFPEMLGQPLTWTVGNTKPAAPNRFTNDVIDLPPEPDKGYELHRKSLPGARKNEGSYHFSCQYDLEPVDPESTIFNIADIQEVELEDVPTEGIRVYRAVDFASSKKTSASSAMVTAVYHKTGVYITHIYYEGRATPSDLLLELVLGTLRCKDAGFPIYRNFFEKAAIEHTLADFLDKAEKNTFNYFTALGGKYERAAKQLFEDIPNIRIPRHSIPRGGTQSKNQRIVSMQPQVEANQLYIVRDIRNSEPFFDQMREFTMESNDTFDILDCIRDIIVVGKAPLDKAKIETPKSNLYNEHIRKAQLQYRNFNYVQKRGVGYR